MNFGKYQIKKGTCVVSIHISLLTNNFPNITGKTPIFLHTSQCISHVFSKGCLKKPLKMATSHLFSTHIEIRRFTNLPFSILKIFQIGHKIENLGRFGIE